MASTRQTDRADGGVVGTVPLGREALYPPAESLRSLLLETWAGRILLGSLLVRLLTAAAGAAGIAAGLLTALDRLAVFGLVWGLLYLTIRLAVAIKRRLLWRVRRRLILSYVLIGFVPVLLIVAFFLFAGLLMVFNVSSYLITRGFDDVVEETVVIAQTAAVEIQRAGARDVLDRKIVNAVDRYPGISIALVSTSPPLGPPGVRVAPVTAGPWRHVEPPAALPSWIRDEGFGGLLAVTRPGAAGPDLVARGVGLPELGAPAWAVIVDIPVDAVVTARIEEETGIQIAGTGAAPIVIDGARQLEGPPVAPDEPARQGVAAEGRWYVFNWVTFLDDTDWASGETGRVSLSTRVNVPDIYARISAAQSRLGDVNLGEVFLIALAVIAALFLIIEMVALVMGFALARSITGSVHALFHGTARVRQGDFSHRIAIRTRDQLGELAHSFNAMTASIEDLLQQAAEKRRMEEELRIARDIQMSLLPRVTTVVPGIEITALCEPAREVGGDYYDCFALPGDRLGVLIADVSGKGTAAALYMAELKGIVLSLSRLIASPRDLLIEVNRTISETLDSRSFITVTYAVVDPAARTITYVRAGHTPLIYLPGQGAGRREARALAPDGLVVGLQLDGMELRFAELLQEARLPIAPGDLFVLYTDGISEAMNAREELFGDARLLQLIEEHGHLPSGQLRERILREVEAFVGGAERHDDMTMVLIRIGDLEARALSAPAVEVGAHDA